MYNLKLENGDIVFDGFNSLAYAFEGKERAQQIERTLTTRLTEWFLNGEIGLDWDITFAKPYIQDTVENEIRNTILQVEGISNVQLNLKLIDRSLEVTFTADYNGEAIEGVAVIG